MADFGEAECGMKRIRFRIRWTAVDFANHAFVSRLGSLCEQVAVERSRQSAAACGGGDHHPIDIDEARIARAEPEKVRTVVGRILIECQQEGIESANASREERVGNEMLQPRRLEP